MSQREMLEAVKHGYELLEQDDIEPFLDICSPDAVWVYPAEGRIPYGGTWLGREGVAAFLEAHDGAEEILEIELEQFLVDGQRAVVLGTFRGRARATGREWTTRFAHAIALRDGLWQRFEAYFDTAAATAAHEPPG